MLSYFSQKDPRWKNIKIGTCKDTFAQSGCLITALAMLCGKTPPEVNDILNPECYNYGCKVVSDKAAKFLGLEYLGIASAKDKPDFICIAETDYYAPKIKQHFFVFIPPDKIVDPLDIDPKPKKNKYNIVSYRLFKEKIMPNEIPADYQSLSAGEYKRLFKLVWGQDIPDTDCDWYAKNVKGGDGVTRILQDKRAAIWEQKVAEMLESGDIAEKNKALENAAKQIELLTAKSQSLQNNMDKIKEICS